MKTFTLVSLDGRKHRARLLNARELGEFSTLPPREAAFGMLARSLGRDDADVVAQTFALSAATFVADLALANLTGRRGGTYDGSFSWHSETKR